jgi:methionine synthase I (cobalamin-dependent)
VAGDIGPSGEIMHPLGPLGFDEARDGFQEQAEALVTAGVDLIWIETMYDASEARAAVGGVRAVDASVPIILSFTFDTRGHTMMGLSPEEAVSLARELDVQACGGNCGTGPDELVDVIRKMRAVDPDMVLVAKSNAGVPVLRGTETAYPAEPDFMAHYSAELYEAGAKIIGGCCGNHAEHIEAIGKELARRS